MKKLLLIFALIGMCVSGFSQSKNVHIAFGAKGIDSISGATTAYFYLNLTSANYALGTAGTAAIGTATHVKSTAPITLYRIASVQAMAIHPAVYTASDSCHFTLEYSLDNSSWVKWTNAGATSAATNVLNYLNAPQIIGSNAAYLIGGDLVTTTSTDAGAIWMPRNMVVPYFRLAVQRYKASSASYIQAWVMLAPIK
jgi:hypothetical protein